MSKKRTRDMANNTTDVEMHVCNKIQSQKCEQTKLQNIAPVCILFDTGIDYLFSCVSHKATQRYDSLSL